MAKTIVKHWHGVSNDSSKADYKEFPTKKEAVAYVKKMRYFHNRHGCQIGGMCDFYEIYKKTQS